jgi:hypothetical protein
MDTKEQLAPQAPVVVMRPSRRGPFALIAAALATTALVVGIGATQGSAPAPRSAQSAISVPAGRTQPATRIYRIAMRPTEGAISVPAGRTQPATRIHRISMRPVPAQPAH